MNIEKTIKKAECAFDSYKESDPLMIRKNVCIKDIAYRKNTPEREVWHAEIAFDHDFYAAVIVGAVGAIILFAAVKKGMGNLCSKCRKNRS